MGHVLAMLGFSTLASGLWNMFAYIAFGAIIYAFQTSRAINPIVFIAGTVLGIYAYAYLGNPLFMILQAIIAGSALLSIMRVGRMILIGILVSATVTAIVWLFGNGYLASAIDVVGAVGLTGIAFGLILLPAALGSLVLAGSGVLLIWFSLASKVWVFFALNIYFAVANGNNWWKTRQRKATSQ